MKQKRKDKIIDKETNFATKVVRKLKNIDIFIPIIIALSLINPLRAAISQYYILPYRDDIMWISWASKHYNQISDILFTKLGTGLRPMMNFWYAFGFSLWGSNEKGYFILNGLLFAGSMVFLYLLIKQLHGRMAGIISVLLFLFLDATFILVWKLNYISSIGEIFFITSSLYFSIRFFEKKERICILLAIILAILAFLSKEESIIIIPTINIIYLFHKWESIGKKTRTVALALNIFPIILF